MNVYSLICWGGKDGLSVTVSSSTDYVTLSAHGLHDATPVVFSSGTLPSVSGTALSLNTPYYSKSISSSTFELYYDSGLTSKINFTTNGTSLYMKSKYYTDLTDKSRWTYGGTEYIFDSMTNWVNGRSTADINDVEICEIGMAWDDETSNNGITISIPCGEIIITTEINGVRSAGYHGGVVGLEAASGAVGYRLFRRSPQNSRTLNLSQARTTVDGFTVWSYSGMSGYTVNGIEIAAGLIKVQNMIVQGRGNNTGTGIYFTSGTTYSDVVNCLVLGGWSSGINVFQYRTGISVCSCLTTGNTTGMGSYASTNAVGIFMDNISIGNTTNWATTSGFTKARNNAGLSTDSPWDSVGGTSISMVTSDFNNYAGNDFNPASASSPQVDAAVDFYGSSNYAYDIQGNERPSYNNGGSEASDVGPYEYDLGYGPHPTPGYERGQEFTGLVAGSLVKVFETGTDTEVFSTTSSSTTESWDDATSGSITVDYVVMKTGYVPIRVAGVVLTGAVGTGVVSTPIDQKVDRAYVASSGLTIDTNVFVNTSTKKLGLTTASELQNLYSYLIEQWIALGDEGEALANKAFPFETTGTNSFSLLNGWEFDLTTYASSITNLSGDGLRYLDASRVTTAQWACIKAVGVPSGEYVRLQQSDGGTTVEASTTGDIDELFQIYGDSSHGNFDKRGYMVTKVQAEGYDQAVVDVVAQYGNLEDYAYTVALAPTANGIATGDPGLASPPTITDHAGSPVTWHSKSFSITITDSAAGNSGEDIMKWLRYNFSQGGTFQGKDAFDWHDLVQVNGSKFKTVRGAVYGDTGATLKGVRVVQNDGTSDHPDFTLYTADDGTTYAPAPSATVTVGPFVTGSRVQLYDTDNDVELFNDVVAGTSKVFSETYSVDRTVRARIAYVDGTDAKQFIEVTVGTLTSANPNISAILTQVEDTVYTTNAVDGSAVTGITFTDSATDVVNIDVASGSVTLQSIYAAFVYWMGTEAGIANDIAYIDAVDTANYILTSMIIKNTSSPSVPLEITGGYAVDSATGASIDLVDTTGGTLIFAPDHVVAKIVTVGGANVITGDIDDVTAKVQAGMTAQGYTTTRAEKIDTISTNVVKASKLIPANE